MTSYSTRTRAYIRFSLLKRSIRKRVRPLTFNSVKSFIVELFSRVLVRLIRLISIRE
jgi:hypothetical protein